MKRWSSMGVTFLAGAVVASVGWGWYVLILQIDMSVAYTSTLVREAELGQMMCSYIDSPDDLKAHRLEFAASNTVVNLPADIDDVDRRFLWMNLSARLSPSIERAEEFMRQRQPGTPASPKVGEQ
jgi:hypothetical protein